MAKAAAPEAVISNDINDVMVRKMKAIRQLKSMIESKRTIKANILSRTHRVDNGLVAKLERADFIRKQSRGVYVWNGGDISKDDNLIAMIDLVYPRLDRGGKTPPAARKAYTRRAFATPPAKPNFGMTDYEILAYDVLTQVDDVVIMKVIARRRPAQTPTTSLSGVVQEGKAESNGVATSNAF
jgi:hypothetical protein